MTKLQDLKLGIYEKAIPLQLSWREKMELAKASGYDFIELSIDGLSPRIHRLDWSEQEIADIRRAIEETGVPLLTMALTANRYFPLGDDRKDIRDQGIEIVKKGIRLAVKLGVRVIQLAAYDVFERQGTPENDRLFRDALRICTAYAASHGVMLSLEVMDCPYSNTAGKVLDFVREVGSPFLQIYYDTGNVASAGYDPAKDFIDGGQHIVAVHVKDAYPQVCREVPFGDGIVDFDACFATFARQNYCGLLIAEMWSNEDMEFVPYLETASRFIREKISAVRV